MKIPTILLTQTLADGSFTLSDATAMLIVLFFFFLLVIALLLICREPICWYFKINQIKRQQEEILRLLRDIKKQ